ncbi:hypothetical protein [Microbacterium flavescens]|uniref:hypothetical protein n=1 Tax=Microbacterium flavescens TaxID=69366 RepID=UPI001BDE8208|nr:hypothetical protein [Microbacterium flavescens]
MTRPLLADFVASVGETPGVLPDGQVLGSSKTDWTRVFDLIKQRGWDAAWNGDGRAVVLEDLDDPSREGESFALRPIPAVQINCFPGDEEVLFDIDLREFNNQDALDALTAFMADLGSVLSMPVVISSEGDYADVIVRYDPDSREFSLRESS